MAEPALVRNQIAPLAELTGGRLKMVSDQELLASTRRLVGASNQILAELLAHLAEVEARGVHRVRLCTSLYTYCIYELRFSEDAAFRRVSAARLMQKFPALYDVIASGELHLTGILQVGPHLTPQNFSEVVARAKHRTKKELAKLVRELDPFPDVPARIEPLGPVLPPTMKVRNPTWDEYMRGLTPVNHLLPGERPRDWMSETPFASLSQVDGCRGRLEDPGTPQANRSRMAPYVLENGADRLAIDGTGGEGRREERALTAPHWRDDEWTQQPSDLELDGATQLDSGGRERLVSPTQRFAVQFTASQEYVDLVARAQALLSHTSKGDLEELHLRAMKLLVQELERKKFATTKRQLSSDAKRGTTKRRSRPWAEDAAAERSVAGDVQEGERDASDTESSGAPRPSTPMADLVRAAAGEIVGVAGDSSVNSTAAEGTVGVNDDPALGAGTDVGGDTLSHDSAGSDGPAAPRRRGRYISAAVRRAVLERDGLRCTHTDETGARCAETHRLEFHHVRAFARGGEHTIENVTLRCRAHNDLAAEEDFGVDQLRTARERQRHESLARQTERR